MQKIPIIPIEKRFSWIVPAKPYYLGLMIKWGVFSMGKKYKFSWPESWVFIKRNDKAYFYDYIADVDNGGLKAIAGLYKKNGRFKNEKKKYNQIVKTLNHKTDEINPLVLKKLNNKEFVNKYRDFLNDVKEFWFTAIFAELSGYGSETYLKNKLPDKLFANRAEAISILLKPSDYSFFQKEEIAMLKILSASKVNKRFTKYSDWLKYLKNNISLKEKIDNHAQKYNWINNSYQSNKPETNSYFYKKFWQAVNDKEKPKDKLVKIKKDFKFGEIKRKRVLSKIPSGELKIYAQGAGGSVAWHDDKKGRQLKFQRSLHYFLKEIAKRYSFNFYRLLECTPDEVDKILIVGKLPIKELKKRKRLFLFHASPTKFEIITGQEANRAFKLYNQPISKSVSTFSGITVAKTKNIVKGRARIILDLKNINKMKQGEILVAEMTSPEYIVAIKKAKAIITDHGGMTCHAAIISRELGIPCIVGTKIATQALKDGDMVEVDADKGIVRKI